MRQFFLLFMALLTTASAQEQLFVGTRPLGMGGAFMAVADDGNTITWNPAGLPRLRRKEFNSTYADLYGMGISHSYIGIVWPFSDRLALGMDWASLGFDDQELGYSDNKLNFSFGYQPFKMISIGGTMKYVFRDMSLDGTSYGKSDGFGFDVGLLIAPLKNLRLGIGLFDLGGTSVTYKNKVDETILGQAFKMGIAYFPIEGLTLAMDIDDRLHFGVEYFVKNRLGIRAGIQQDMEGDERLVIPSAGMTIKFKSIVFEYGYEAHPYLDPTYRYSVSIQLSPAVVSISSAKIEQNPIFRSLHRYYESNPFVTVGIKNISDADLPVDVSLYLPTMMEDPHTESITLPPKSDEEYELGISFSSDVLTSAKASFDNLVQPDLKVTYKQGGEEKFAQKKLESSYVLGKGKLTWSDPEMIACYFTTQDVVVDKFARMNIQFYSDVLKKYFGRSNLGRAIILYDALGTYGLVYNVDPSTPFLQISDDKSAFDTVKYPWELLDDKIGDCDDLTTLYSTLLNNLGIETMFLDVFKPGEGHVFLMFDSGIAPDDVNRLFLDPGEVAVIDDKVWIPVEATLVGKNFFSAWKQGALKYNQMKAEQFVNEISMTKAMAKYQSGAVTPEEVFIPDLTGINELLTEDIKLYSSWLDQIVYKAVENKLETAEDYYDAAVLYMDFGRYKRATEYLESAINVKPVFPDAVNTLGVCYTKQGEYERSIQYYEQALQQQANHPGFMLNIVISHFMMGNKGIAKQKYDEVVAIDPVFAGKLEDILGSAKASAIPPSGSKLSIPPDLEAELEAGSSKDLSDLKKRAPKLTPEAVQRVSYRARRARSDNAVGITFAQIGNNAMAVDYFKKAVEKDPEPAEYKANLAVALYRVRKYERAFTLFEEIKQDNPELVTQLSFIESMGEVTSKYKKFD